MASLKRSADEALGDSQDEERVNNTGGDPSARGEALREQAPQIKNGLNLTGALPKLVVLDLDKTASL